MLKQNHEVDTPPSCFGKHFDATSPECKGGHDPSFRNDDRNSPGGHYGTQVRDVCDWVQSCSSRMQASRNFIPASSLVRPQPPPSPYQTRFNQPTQPQLQPWKPPTYTPQQTGANLMSTHFGIPQYLTIREPQTHGTSFGKRLARESLRSILKSIGHTIAHFFDVEVLGPPPPGGGSPHE